MRLPPTEVTQTLRNISPDICQQVPENPGCCQNNRFSYLPAAPGGPRSKACEIERGEGEGEHGSENPVLHHGETLQQEQRPESAEPASEREQHTLGLTLGTNGCW